MALSRLSVRGFQASRSALAGLASSDGVQRGSKVGAVPARTLFGMRDGERRGKSQSRVLSREGHLFELQVHQVKPECMEDYQKLASDHLIRISESADIPVELLGSWTTMIGSCQDEATLIWMYKGHYDTVNQTNEALKNDKVWQEFNSLRSKMVVSRGNQIVLPFAFWDPTDTEASGDKGLYELRSYLLRPGTLIEWGQAWERGIKYRKDEAVGGWFSQIGMMHKVYHLWAYKDLADRAETRQAAWEFPGWDECVRWTVPLIRQMEAKILVPSSYSPLQ